MRTLAVIFAIALLAAPDLAAAQGRRMRDDDGGGRDRPSASQFADRDGGGGGRRRPDRERPRDDDDNDRPRQRPDRRPVVRDEGGGGNAGRERPRVPLRSVLPDIQRRTPGRILDNFPETDRSGRAVYRVRWQANDGQRIDYIVDAETGAILRRE